MQSRRVALPTAVLVFSLLALTGCDKPHPNATVFSGSNSVTRAAICWSPDANRTFTDSECLVQVADGKLSAQAVAELADYLEPIPVKPAQTIGISVDPEIADAGWTITINSRPLNSQPISTTYYRFALSERDLRRGSLEMRVFAAADDQKSQRGYWLFELSPEE